jgi:hypothetical protein
VLHQRGMREDGLRLPRSRSLAVEAKRKALEGTVNKQAQQSPAEEKPAKAPPVQ